MPVSHAIVLGIVQGLTEVFPISSSAHLVLVPWFLKWHYQGLSFDVALHMGTAAADASFSAEAYRLAQAMLTARAAKLAELAKERGA